MVKLRGMMLRSAFTAFHRMAWWGTRAAAIVLHDLGSSAFYYQPAGSRGDDDLGLARPEDVAPATAYTAAQLDALEIIAGRSAVMTPTVQARYLGRSWDQLPQRPRHPVRLRIIAADGRMSLFSLGAYDPQLTTDDIELLHRLWLELTSIPGQEQIHHRDVIHVALRHLAADLSGPGRTQLLATVVAPRAAPHARRS